MFGALKSLVSTPSSSPPPAPVDATPAADVTPAPADAFKPPLPKPEYLAALRETVPCVECSSCDVDSDDLATPDEEHYPTFPSKFDMDLDTEMLGEIIKPMHRLAVISTNKTDWPHDIATDSQSLAFHLAAAQQKKLPPKEELTALGNQLKESSLAKLPGLYTSNEEAKLSVLASSVEIDQHDGETSVLVFPDFKVVQSVPISKTGAQNLYDKALSPTVARLGDPSVNPSLKSWVLPYEAVILLCSHKTRDKRCHIAAPMLEDVITSTLSVHGYAVDNKGSALHDLSSAEQLETLDEGEEGVERLLRKVAGGKQGGGSKEVGVFKISHLGGHRYSGVMIICFPSGSVLYYGRVTPKSCVQVVEQTILKGKILPEHLRGGANLTRTSGQSLLEW